MPRKIRRAEDVLAKLTPIEEDDGAFLKYDAVSMRQPKRTT